MTTSSTALILGITGSVGQAIARALAHHGWQLRALHRQPARAGARLSDLAIDWRGGDALDATSVRDAAAGCDVIVHAVNPPGYRNWRTLALPMLDNSLAAARASGATLAFPGNVYNFGPDAWPEVAEDAPQRPLTRKGQVRVEMEDRLASAAGEGVRSLTVRAGDFFGPDAASAWFDQVLVKPGRPLRAITYPGRLDRPHSWAYLPDLAATFARLLARRDELDAHAVFHFGGHAPSGADLVAALRRVGGDPTVPVRKLPWGVLRLVGLFNETYRELMEMRYLWDETLVLDNRRLVAFLGEEPHTPLDQALESTLDALGCLPSNRGGTVMG